MTWREARTPQWDDHPAVITDKGKVVWWLAIYRYLHTAEEAGR